MKQLFIYILIFISTLLLFNCKKYDEDGKRSWHKPEKRIIGTWYLKEFLVDGADSTYTWYEKKTSDVTDTIKWQLIDARFTFDYDKNGNNIDVYLKNAYVNNSLNWIYTALHLKGKWSFENKKQVLVFDSNYNYEKQSIIMISFSIFGNVTDLWDIKKLTDKEIILEAYSNTNKNLRLKLQK